MRVSKSTCTYPISLSNFIHLIFFEKDFMDQFLTNRGLTDYSISQITTLVNGHAITYTGSLEKFSIKDKQAFTRTMQISSDINAPKILNINHGEIAVLELMTWHTDRHFASTLEITIISDLPFKECFSFEVVWNVTAVSGSTLVNIETKCAFNKTFFVGTSLVESAMDKYLVKLTNKWQKQAQEYIDHQALKLKNKHRGARMLDGGIATMRQRVEAPAIEKEDESIGTDIDSTIEEHVPLVKEKRKKPICCCFC